MPSEPFEILVGPASIWVAPVGTAFPDVDAAPAVDWVSLGKTDGGVTVTHMRETAEHMVDQSAMPQKMTLTSRRESIKFKIAEITPETYATVIDDATVTTVPAASGVAGEKSFPLGANSLPCMALLLRGPSPVMDAYMQYEYAVVHPTGDVELAFTKDGKTVLPVEFRAMEDPDNAGQFGTCRIQTAAALP